MKSQRGSVAIIALVFLLFLAIVGASWLPMLDTEAKHAKMDSDEQMAWYAAEAGYKRAVANLRNGASGGNEMVWGLSSNSNPQKMDNWQNLDDSKKIQYAVYISEMDTSDTKSYKANATMHEITAVGLVNGVRKVITGQEDTSSGGGGDGIFSELNFIERLLFASGATSDENIKRVADYFAKKGNVSLDSFGGNFAKYLGSNFWNEVVNLILAGNYDTVTLLQDVGSRDGAPFTILVGTHYYDVTPEHYLWKINNQNGKYTIQWAYIGSAFDNTMGYTDKVAVSTGPKVDLSEKRLDGQEKNGNTVKPDVYYVTIEPVKYKNGFLPVLGGDNVKYVGNALASKIKQGEVNLPNVHQFTVTSLSGAGFEVLKPEKIKIYIKTSGNYGNYDYFDALVYGGSVEGNAGYSSDTDDYPIEGLTSGPIESIDMKLLREVLGKSTYVKILKLLGWDEIKMLSYLNKPNNEEHKDNENNAVALKYATKTYPQVTINESNASKYAGYFIRALNESGKGVGFNLDSGNITADTVSAIWMAMENLELADSKTYGFTVDQKNKRVYVYSTLKNIGDVVTVYMFKFSGDAKMWTLTADPMKVCTATVIGKTNGNLTFLAIDPDKVIIPN